MSAIPSHLPADAGHAAHLLDSYQVGERLLATPTRILLSHGVRRGVIQDERALAQRLSAKLAQMRSEVREDAVVMGAGPFFPGAPDALVVPEQIEMAGSLADDPLLGSVLRPPRLASLQVTPEPAPEE